MNRRIVKFATSRQLTERTPFAWGFIEATFFVLVPDIAIAYVSAYARRKALPAVLYAVLGAVIGGVVVFLFPLWWQSVFLHLPGINQGMMQRVEGLIAEDGLLSVVVGPTLGIPYKLYAAELALQGHSVISLIAITPVARGWRFLMVAGIGVLVGRFLHGLLQRHALPVLAVYLLTWTVFYVVYFRSVAQEYAA